MAVKSIHLKIKGMHCTGCEETIENAVVTLPGVQKVHADYVKQVVDVEFDSKSLPESGRPAFLLWFMV
jgi:copper chaperone CopZ